MRVLRVRLRLLARLSQRHRRGLLLCQALGARRRPRLRAVRMLGQLKDKEAIPVLAKALEDPDPAVQYRAVASLKQVSGRDLGDDVNKWRAWAADPEADKGQWSVAETFRKIF